MRADQLRLRKAGFNTDNIEMPLSETDKELATEKERSIKCRFCGKTVTSPNKKLEIDGACRHVFTNPAGFVFRIACFSDASGCGIFGDFSEENTWFPGFSWCYAVCSGCYNHLGWYYLSDGSSFFGLILDNLVE